jgi:hypothetical protein
MATRRSHSQLSQMTQCGKRYQLERRVGVPSLPGWWNAGGTAVHATIERWLRERIKEDA